MKKIKTKIKDSQFLKIQKTEKSIYQFFQEAIREELENEENQANKKMIEDSLLKIIEISVAEKKKLKKIFEKMKKQDEENQALTKQAQENTITAFLKLDEQSRIM